MNRYKKHLIAACIGIAGFTILGGFSTQVLANANFIFINLDEANEGFNDSTAVAPVTGNLGTTLGQQRINVFLAALSEWGGILNSAVDIRVQAHFDVLFCNSSSATLGSAGPLTAHRNFTNAPLLDTWYGGALANSIAGSDLSSNNDINATFNSALNGAASCLGGAAWNYQIPSSGTPLSLFSVVMHELGHGLNFLTFVDKQNGAYFGGLPDVYLTFLQDQGTNKDWTDMTTSERKISATSGNVFWMGASAKTAATEAPLTAGQDDNTHNIKIYAPNSLSSGSSISHWDTSLFPNELMEPFSSNNPQKLVTTAALEDMGWSLVITPVDSDNDGIPNNIDNCPTVSNPAQADVDNDSLGDACDTDDYDNDGLSDQQEFQLGTDPADPDTDNDGTPDGQDSDPLDDTYQGTALGSTVVTHNWGNVQLPSLFKAPVVIAGPPSFHGSDPGVVRIRNITANSFEAKYELRFQEWDYEDGGHTSETIPHIVLEEGRHVMSDGSIWEVGSYSQSGTGRLQTQLFTQAFTDIPELFLTLQTYQGGQAVTVRAKNLSISGFDSTLHEQESLMDGHLTEKIAYLAIYSPNKSGRVNIAGKDIPYIVRQVKVNHRWVPVLSSAIKIEEEISRDTETAHLKESLSILGLGGQLFAQDISLLGGDTMALRQKPAEYTAAVEWGTIEGITDQWSTIPLSKNYTQAIVVAKLGQLNETDSAVLRIRNVTPDSFQVRVQEWNYLDGTHTGERIHYLVAEQGTTAVAGLKLQAGKLETNTELRAHTPANVSFSTGYYTKVPAVFAGVMSFKDTDTVTTRVDLIDSNGFNVSIQEQENKADGHAIETIGWIAIEPGTGQTDDGRKIEVNSVNTNHKTLELFFSNIVDRIQAISLGSLSSAAGSDPATAQQTAISDSAVSYKVNEEQSKDAELSHVIESISVFVAE